MKRDRLTFDLRLAVRSPFLFRGLDGRFVGVDVTHLRDQEGRLVVPADQVRGVFRQNLAILAEHVPLPNGSVDDLFGRPSAPTDEEDAVGNNEPGRGLILFDDLVASRIVADPDDEKAPELPFVAGAVRETTRIAIDEESGSVKEGALQVLELAAPFGAAVFFEGRITLFDTGERADAWAKTLSRALALTSAIGAMKSPGWGEVIRSRSSLAKASVVPLVLPEKARLLPDRVRLRMTFDRSILVDAAKVSGNAVEGRAVVPGSVIKGALARRLELAGLSPAEGLLGNVLAALKFGHARPEAVSEGDVSDRPLPLSLVVARGRNGSRLGDASLVGLEEGAMIDGAPATFQPDWKGSDFAAAAAGLARPENWPEPALDVRTHTAIDEDGGAAEGKLFTTIARSSKRRDGTSEGRPVWVNRTWLLDVDLGAARSVDPGSADRLVEALLADGLDGIGRTGARAAFEFAGPGPIMTPKPVRGTADLWIVTLETPAALLDAADLGDGAGGTVSAETAYRRRWKAILPTAELVNFFAAQDYRGGYLARRRRLHGRTYFPFLLTREGSVFVLRTTDVAGLERLVRNGLPHFEPTDGTPVSWSSSPWVNENGFGEVRIDHLSDETTRALADVVVGTKTSGGAA